MLKSRAEARPLISDSKTMRYGKIWEKVLSEGESVEFEFTIGHGYVVAGLVTWGLLGLCLLAFKPVAWLGTIILILALFRHLFYLKRANVFAFTNRHVLVHRGWLSTNTISVDYQKITDVHVGEPFLDRIITHTGSLAVITAGTTADQIVLRHISEPYEVKKKLDALIRP